MSFCPLSISLMMKSVQVAPYDLFEAALRLDGPTLQNLELLETQEGECKGSLMSVLDTCASAGECLLQLCLYNMISVVLQAVTNVFTPFIPSLLNSLQSHF